MVEHCALGKNYETQQQLITILCIIIRNSHGSVVRGWTLTRQVTKTSALMHKIPHLTGVQCACQIQTGISIMHNIKRRFSA